MAKQHLQKEGKELTNKEWRKKVLELFQKFNTNLLTFEKQKSDYRQITMNDFLEIVLSGKKRKVGK